jgi:membrane-associated protein
MEQIFSTLPSFLQFSNVSYEIIVLVVGFLEGLPVIGSLVPGGTIAIVLGTYVQSGAVSFWASVFSLSLGSFLGDLTGYGIGSCAKNSKFVQKIIQKESVQTRLEFFEKRLFVILVLGRMVPVVRSAPAIIAGAHGVKFSKYLLYNLMGSFLWSFFGVLLGMFTGKVVGKYAIPAIITVTILIVIVTFLKKKK